MLSSIVPTTHPAGLVPPGAPQMTHSLVFRVHCLQWDSTKSGNKATAETILALVHNINNDSADELLCQGLTFLAHSPSLPVQTTAEDKFWTAEEAQQVP